MTDVTKIILTPAEQRAFDKFVGESDTADLTKGEFELLRNRRLKALRAYQAVQTRNVKKNDRRYWITTGIAIAALIKSFRPEISSALAWLLTLSGQ